MDKGDKRQTFLIYVKRQDVVVVVYEIYKNFNCLNTSNVKGLNLQETAYRHHSEIKKEKKKLEFYFFCDVSATGQNKDKNKSTFSMRQLSRQHKRDFVLLKRHENAAISPCSLSKYRLSRLAASDLDQKKTS